MRTVVRAFGEICLTLGTVIVLFLAYLIWGTSLHENRAQHAFASELQRQWGQHDPRGEKALPDPIHLVVGKPFAFIEIPRFGRHWRFAIVEGTGLPQLALGPGHVTGTALPGRLGNFAVAAHRVTAGNPFYHLPDLVVGDLVIIDTEVNRYIYRVTRKLEVLPTDSWVLDPVPGHPGEWPRKRLITMITCDPPWTGTHRIIVFGVLVKAEARRGLAA